MIPRAKIAPEEVNGALCRLGVANISVHRGMTHGPACGCGTDVYKCSSCFALRYTPSQQLLKVTL